MRFIMVDSENSLNLIIITGAREWPRDDAVVAAARLGYQSENQRKSCRKLTNECPGVAAERSELSHLSGGLLAVRPEKRGA